ncbi:MAG: ParB N-terminal domain-containing protein [Polyangiaceae bacterium]
MTFDGISAQEKLTAGGQEVAPGTLAHLAGLATGTILRVDVSSLRPHPDNADLFPPESPESDKALDEDIANHGVERPLLVTGDGCASPPGTVLRGHRRLQSAIRVGVKEVRAEIVTGYSADVERLAMIRDNLAGTHQRRLSQERKAALEAEVYKILGRRKGERTDLGTWVRSEPGSQVSARTNKLVAAEVGETTSAVRDRRKIFASPITPDVLKAAVNDGKVSRSQAASLVRSAEVASTAKGKPVDVAVARARLTESVERVLQGRGPGRSSSAGRKTRGKGKDVRGRATLAWKSGLSVVPQTNGPHAPTSMDELRDAVKVAASALLALVVPRTVRAASKLLDDALGVPGVTEERVEQMQVTLDQVFRLTALLKPIIDGPFDSVLDELAGPEGTSTDARPPRGNEWLAPAALSLIGDGDARNRVSA